MHREKAALGLWTLVLLLKVASADACPSNRFTLSGECCRFCPAGFGVAGQCGRENTKCEPCQDARGSGTLAVGTFSEESSHDRTCQPCSQCQDNEVEIRACQPNSDTLCMDPSFIPSSSCHPAIERHLHILSRPTESDGPRREGAEASPTSGEPRFTPQDEGGNSIIPVYVSVLAAVVLGLLLYVAYKCRTSCKQKQALGKARSGDPSSAPEGEKLHSDSGVFLDSHSLQETQLSKGSKRDSKLDTRLYLNVAPHRGEEVERLLQEGGDWSWRQLAAQLGYEQQQTDMFGRGEDPVHTLLSDWAAQDGSTLGVLCSALTKIDRADVATLLCCPTQGSSVV